MHWHFLVSPPDGGARNMALDEALMRRVALHPDTAVFRVYGWAAPTLSLGRNQRARGVYNMEAVRTRGVGVVRRPTGGRALLHHREITYSVTMRADDPAAARRAYDFINGILLAALKRVGVAAERAPEAVALPPGPRPCFDVPAEHEIVVRGRKLVGSAQWRKDDALLQHGSILVADDQGLIGELMHATEAATPAAATLTDALGREPSTDEMTDVIQRALESAVGATAPLALDDVLLAEVDRLESEYRDERWTWRR